MKHTIKPTRAVLALVSAGLALTVPTQAATLTEYYQNQPVEGVPQPQTSFALGTDWTLTLSPDSLYAQNTGFNAGTSYRTLYGDGNNLLFKFNRTVGDNNAYDVTVDLSGYNQWSGAVGTSPSITLHWGTDAFGINDNDTANHGRIWWTADTANLTQVASNTGNGGFTWNSGNVSNFRIGADQQSAYLMVLGSANSYSYVYSASADFTAVAVPEPASVAMTMGAAGLFLLRRRRIS
jgi:hypothetical protein